MMARSIFKVAAQHMHRLATAVAPAFPRGWLLVLASFAAIAMLASFNAHKLGEVTVATWATIFLSSMLSSVVGFAYSAIAGAILFHIDNSYSHVVQTMLVASISLQSYSVFHLRKHINVESLLPFLAGGAATLLIGAYVAIHTKPELLLLLVGAFLVFYGLYTFRGIPPKLQSTSRTGDFIAGALGGITGPIIAFPGAFVTIVCTLKGWDKSRQRGVYQPYILVMQILSLAGLLLMDRAAAVDWSVLQYMLPAIFGAFFGVKLFARLAERQFISLIAIFLTVSGAAMIVKVL